MYPTHCTPRETQGEGDAERDTHKKAIHKIEKALGEKEWFDLTILHLYTTQQKGWRWRGHNLIIAER